MKTAYLISSLVVIVSLTACTQDNEITSLDSEKEIEASAGNSEVELLLKTEVEKFSYIVGGDVGLQFFQSQTVIDQDAFTLGMADALNNKRHRLSKEDAEAVVKDYYRLQQKKAADFQADMQLKADKNQQEGQEFLLQNRNKAGVITTSSGLQYRIIIAGTGLSPTAESDVLVHYKGTYVDGREFDSSSQHDGAKAVKINLGQVIPGWTEALQLMKEGSKWEIYLTPELAYGKDGSSPTIEPMTTLIFEVELEQVIAPK